METFKSEAQPFGFGFGHQENEPAGKICEQVFSSDTQILCTDTSL